MFWLIFLLKILFKTWNSLQFQSFMHISHRPRLEEMRLVSSFMILSIKLISPQRFGWVWALNQKQNSSRHKGKAMESDCPSRCELKLPCYAQYRSQKHIELTLQHPGAAKDSGFQLWSSHEQNRLLHKLVLETGKLPIHHKWWSGNLTPAAGWPPGMSVPCMCKSEGYLLLSCALLAACSSCYCSVFQLGNKKICYVLALVLLLLGSGQDTTGIFLGQTLAQCPVLDSRVGVMGWRIPLPWTGCLVELCLSWVHHKPLL